MDDNQKLTILMTSCKAYWDVLQIHDILFKKYWTDCPFEIILVTDEVAGETSLYSKVIDAGKEAQGNKNATRIVKALHNIDTPYVMLLQEDFYLCDKVHTNKIFNILHMMSKYHAANIRMIQSPITTVVYSEEDALMEYPAGMAYRLSMQAGIWDRLYLLEMFSKYDNGAEFERKGSFESAQFDQPILATKYIAYPFINAIQKGAWQDSALQLLSQNELVPDFNKHPQMTEKQKMINAFKGWIISLNPSFTVKLQNRLNKGKKY